jgi:hypothetical protein
MIDRQNCSFGKHVHQLGQCWQVRSNLGNSFEGQFREHPCRNVCLGSCESGICKCLGPAATFFQLLDASGSPSHPSSHAELSSLQRVGCAENCSNAKLQLPVRILHNLMIFLKKGGRFWAPCPMEKPQAAPKNGPDSGPSFFQPCNR